MDKQTGGPTDGKIGGHTGGWAGRIDTKYGGDRYTDGWRDRQINTQKTLLKPASHLRAQ